MQSAAWKMVDPKKKKKRNKNQLKSTSTFGCLRSFVYVLAHVLEVAVSLALYWLYPLFITFMTCTVCITSPCAWIRLIAEENSKGTRRSTINEQCGVSLDHFPSQLFAGVILNNTNVSNWTMCFHLHEMAHNFRTHWSPAACESRRSADYAFSKRMALRFSHMIGNGVNIQLFRSSSVKPFSINLYAVILMPIPIAASAKTKEKVSIVFAMHSVNGWRMNRHHICCA